MTQNYLSRPILIVDDEPAIVDSLVSYLEICGFTNLSKAYDGFEALGMIKAHNYDLVISDVRMPKMDGIELLEKTIQEFPDKPLFLMITGYTEVKPQVAKSKGAKEILDKPLDLDKLVEKIEFYLNRP